MESFMSSVPAEVPSVTAALIACMATTALLLDRFALADMFFPWCTSAASPRRKWWSFFQAGNWLLSNAFAVCLAGCVSAHYSGHSLLSMMAAPFVASACFLLSYLFLAYSLTVIFKDLGLRTAPAASPASSAVNTGRRTNAAALVLAVGAAMPVCLCAGFTWHMSPQIMSMFSFAALYTWDHALTLEALPWCLLVLVMSVFALRTRSTPADPSKFVLSPLDAKRLESYPVDYANGWFKLADSKDIKRGQVKHIQALGQNFAVFRGADDGAVHILDAYCPHLGANMAVGGKVKGDCLQCPFHLWSFRGDGSVADIPYSSQRPRQGAHAWPSTEFHGLVLVYFDVERRAPPYMPPQIPGLESMKYHGSHAKDVKMHLQEFADNSVDVAHFSVLHGDMMIPWTEYTVPLLKVHHEASWEPGTPEEGKHISHFRNHAHLEIFGKKIPRTDGYADITMVGPCGLVYFTFDIPDVGRIIMFQCHTPTTPMYLKTEFTWYAEPHIPRVLVSYVVGNWVSQWANDLMVWENKRNAIRPTLVKGDGALNRLRSWYKQFYASGKPKVALAPSAPKADSPESTPCAAAGAAEW